MTRSSLVALAIHQGRESAYQPPRLLSVLDWTGLIEEHRKAEAARDDADAVLIYCCDAQAALEYDVASDTIDEIEAEVRNRLEGLVGGRANLDRIQRMM